MFLPDGTVLGAAAPMSNEVRLARRGRSFTTVTPGGVEVLVAVQGLPGGTGTPEDSGGSLTIGRSASGGGSATMGLGPRTGPAGAARGHRRTRGGPPAYLYASAEPVSSFWLDGE